MGEDQIMEFIEQAKELGLDEFLVRNPVALKGTGKGTGNKGTGNKGTGNKGTGNKGTGNKGTGNKGTGNKGTGNKGTDNNKGTGMMG
jgi:hypothetical protein